MSEDLSRLSCGGPEQRRTEVVLFRSSKEAILCKLLINTSCNWDLSPHPKLLCHVPIIMCMHTY